MILGLSALAMLGGALAVHGRATARAQAAEATHPPLGRILSVDGVPVHVVEMGQDGPDLVLIHGASGNVRDYTHGFAQRLARSYRVLIFDRPGLGYTGHVHPEHARTFSSAAASPAQQARLLARAAAMLGAEAPIVAGHSYGGAVALAWALAHPLSGLVVISGASNPWEGPLGPLYRVNGSALGGATAVPLISALAPKAALRRLLHDIFAPDPVPPGYATHIGTGLSLRPHSLRANARQVNGLKPHLAAMAPQYPRIATPTEILHGTADTIVGLERHAAPLSTQIPGAVLTRLEGLGHMPHHVAPQAVAAAIDRVAARAGLR